MKQEILISIIAASSALGGVIISQVFSLLQSFYDKKHKKQTLLRQKYEEMMFHFSASLEWIVSLNGSTTQATVFALAQCPDARKALSLCLLYFSELVEPANSYVLAQQSYYTAIATSFKEDGSFTAGGQAVVKNKQKFDAATKNLFNNKDIFENLIISNAKKYTKA
jgi:hypothetical protein